MLQKIIKNKEEVNEHTGTVEEEISKNLKNLERMLETNNDNYKKNDEIYKKSFEELRLQNNEQSQ